MSGFQTMLERLGSLKLTLGLFVLFLCAVILYYVTDGVSEWLIATPLLLFSLNLIAAIITRPVFRVQLPLLLFHIALIVVVVLIALGRLSYFNGEAEVTTGELFKGELNNFQAGPLHQWKIRDIRFVNEGFEVEYAPGLNRMKTEGRVSWLDENKQRQHAIIGDHIPLIIDGYRFYTTHNKGFAPQFIWRANDAQEVKGSIHFPAYPVNEFEQALEWSLPGMESRMWTSLDFDEVLLNPAEHSTFRVPEKHQLIFRVEGKRHVMRPGDRLKLSAGALTYTGLGTWMGYWVSADWTMPWLVAASFFAVLALAWHYGKKYYSRPWQSNEETSH